MSNIVNIKNGINNGANIIIKGMEIIFKVEIINKHPVNIIIAKRLSSKLIIISTP